LQPRANSIILLILYSSFLIMVRAFISINIPEDLKRAVKEIHDKLPEFKGKKTELENLHLTLKFLGEVNEEKIIEVQKRLKKIKFDSFESEMNSLGVFSEKFIRIIWLHFTNCERLQKEIDRALSELFEKERRFMSHLTIARVKHISDRGKFLKEIKKMKIKKKIFRVKSFCLMKSELTAEGPKYSVLEKYVLD